MQITSLKETVLTKERGS